MSRPINVGALSFALFIEALQEEPQSARDLVDAVGYNVNTVQGYLRAMKKRGCIFIAEYTAAPHNAPMYCLGRRADVKRPPALGPRAAYHERKRRAAAARLDQVIKARLAA